MGETADVLVLGGGVIGLATALELSRRGLTVTVLERGAVGDRATSALGAAAGMVNPQAHPGVEPEPVRDLALLSRHLYADWVEAIEEESGLTCEYDVRGGMTVARSDAEEVTLDRALDWQRARALPFEVLSGEEAFLREPALGEDVHSAFGFPADGQIAPRRLGRALLLACRAAGVTVHEKELVTAVTVEGGRATGVETAGGEAYAGGAVVNAGGAWAAHLSGVPCAPVAPVRGQAALLDAGADGDRLRRFVFAPGVYLVPRRDGTLVVGSTLERAGFDARPTAGGVAGLLERAARVVPAVKGYPLLDLWAGLRPATPDEIPILGPTSVTGYLLAAGHFKNGILLAPASAVVLADLLTEQTPPLPIGPFSAARFDL